MHGEVFLDPGYIFFSGEATKADLMNELNGDYLNYNLTENTYWYNGTLHDRATIETAIGVVYGNICNE